MASGSIPVALQPRHFKGYVLMDGGTVWNVNIDAAINKCREIVSDDSDIIVDIAMCSYHTPNNQTVAKNAFSNFMGGRDIRSYYIGMDAIQAEKRAYNNIEYRYFFQEDRTGCT